MHLQSFMSIWVSCNLDVIKTLLHIKSGSENLKPCFRYSCWSCTLYALCFK